MTFEKFEYGEIHTIKELVQNLFIIGVGAKGFCRLNIEKTFVYQLSGDFTQNKLEGV